MREFEKYCWNLFVCNSSYEFVPCDVFMDASRM
jgi:hypothetical protein